MAGRTYYVTGHVAGNPEPVPRVQVFWGYRIPNPDPYPQRNPQQNPRVLKTRDIP